MTVGLIYKLTCSINNKNYVGQTIEFNVRKRTHFTDAFNKKRRYYENKICRAIRKYGKQNWKYEVLCEDILLEHLNEYERYYVSFYSSFEYGYNSTSGGDSKFNTVHRGKKRSDEVCANISKAKKGRPGPKHTKESKKNISTALKGRKLSEEHLKKLKQNMMMRGPIKGRYKGVSRQKNRWISSIFYNKKSIYLGAFVNEVDAAVAYNKAAIEYFGKECYLNKVDT